MIQYRVFNKRTGRMEQRQIRGGEHDNFYWVSLKGDRQENTESGNFAKAELSVYPNPSSGIFNFNIELKEDAPMVLEIFNCSGKKVASLADGMQNAGFHKLYWEYNRNTGGIYYYRFSSGEYVKNGKLVIIK
ncbi:MAG: T9SS type A sorting domain-containing protein [Bacteroidota bacterium]|nr:T9SS type A sorting domain-containing protein [Bacteroidota bacterium]